MDELVFDETILVIKIESRKMSIYSKVASYNWEKLLAKVDNQDVKRSIELLRAKANEIAVTSTKIPKAPAPIDFASYRQKLKFTASAVDQIEKVCRKKNLPVYSASISSFDVKKRAAMLQVIRSTVDAAKADLELQKTVLLEFEAGRISGATSVGELKNRFPKIAKEIEAEINTHQWAKDSM